MSTVNYKRTKFTCFFNFPAIAPAFILPPILFYTFRQMYGISYTLLGTLVLVNFCTQLGVDLLFTFFSKHFNLHKALRTMPLLHALGLLIYALIPTLFPQYAYTGLVIGTFIFSVAAGLSEVLISPTVAAIPSDNPERDMSALHSLFGYGSAAVALLSTLFLWVFGTENWVYLTLLWAILPLIAFYLFCTSPLPEITMNQDTSAAAAKRKSKGLILCMVCIFLGSAAENTMTNWISVFMENALQMPKMLGDIFGPVSFSLLLALTRTLYAKYGKNIYNILLCSMASASVCYMVAGISSNAVVAIIACMFTGVCTSMLWPGTLILMEEKFPNPGIAAYALMAAGGDFGASVAPQGLGIVVDKVAASGWANQLGEQLSLSTEQIGIKVGMFAAAMIPILGIIVLLYIKKFFSKTA
ncbi:MAG: MFS transporter [Oscillospiraceae bacterium]|nr:MFS transporter [Oscillospiraceae bacterium]